MGKSENDSVTQRYDYWSAIVPLSSSDLQLMVDYYLNANLVCLHTHIWKQLSKEEAGKESVSKLNLITA